MQWKCLQTQSFNIVKTLCHAGLPKVILETNQEWPLELNPCYIKCRCLQNRTQLSNNLLHKIRHREARRLAKTHWKMAEKNFNQSINQSINQTSIVPIPLAKPSSVAQQPNRCSIAKPRKQFRNINRPWRVTVSMGERPSQRDVKNIKCKW